MSYDDNGEKGSLALPASHKLVKVIQDQSTLIPSITGFEESANCSRDGIPFIKNFDEMPLQGVKNRRKLFAMDEDITDLQKRNCRNNDIEVLSEKQESRILKDSSKRALNSSFISNEVQEGTQKLKKKSLKTIQSIRNEEDTSSPLKLRNAVQERDSHSRNESDKCNTETVHTKTDDENSKEDNHQISKNQSNLTNQRKSIYKEQHEQENNITFEDSDDEEIEEDDDGNLSEDQRRQIQQIEKLLDLQQNIKKRERKSKYANLQKDNPNNKSMLTPQHTDLNSQLKGQESCNQLKKTSTFTVKEGSNKQWRDIIILSRVKKFVFKLKQYQFFSKFNNLNGVQLKCIGDLSYDINSYMRKKKQTQLLQDQSKYKYLAKVLYCFCFFSRLLNVLPSFTVITPNTSFALLWNFLLFLTITMQNLCIPLRMSFGLDYLNGINFYILYLIPSVIMNLDLVLNFFTAFYDQGVLVTNKKKIRRNYLQMQFWIDFVTNFSFVLISQNQSFFLVDWIFMIKILQIPEYLSKIDEHFQLEQRFNTVFQLAKLFLLNFFIAHFICCGFHYIGKIEISNGQENTWLHSLELADSSDYLKRYINSIYFAFITMITVGYGDITPKTDNEKIYVILVTVFSCGLFGYSINTIGSIFQEKSRRESNFRSIKFSITQYMRKRNISRNLQLLVVKNLEYRNQIDSNGDSNGEQILNSINEQLKNDVKEEYFFKVLSDSKLLRLNFSRNSLKKLALRVKEKLISPGEIIYKNNVSNRNLYFLIDGSIEFYFENKNTKQPHVLSAIKQTNGVQFNQLGFFCSQTTSYNVRALKNTSLCLVSYEDFQDVLLEYPHDFESFCKVRDNISIYSRLNDIMCYSCNNFGHFTNECPTYFPIAYKQNQVICKYEQSEPNHRKIQVRLRNFKCNSVSLSQNFKVRLKKFRLDVMVLLTQQNRYDQQLSIQSLSDKKFVRSMPKFGYDLANEHYVELPSSEDERYYEEDEDEDEYDDDEIELEEFQKSQISSMRQDHTSRDENEIKSSFKRIACDEDSRLQAEYHKDIYTKNERNFQDGKSEFQTDYQVSHQQTFQDNRAGTISGINQDSEIEVKTHVNTPTIHKRELDSRKGSSFTVKTRTQKQQQKGEFDENTKKRFSNLIYEERSKVSEENEYDDDDSEKDQKSEKFFSSLQQSQIHRSNSASSSKKQIQTSSNRQQNRNASKSEVNSLYNDKGESLHNMKSIISLNRQQSNMSQKGMDVGRSSNLGIKRLISQSMSSNIKNSSKNLSNVKQGTLDYLNSIHYSINNQSEYAEKTYVSQSSIDPVQYKGSQNFSTTCIVRGRSQTGGVGCSMQEVNKNRSGQYVTSQVIKPSFKRMGTTHQDGQVQSRMQKDTKSQRMQQLYDEGFTAVKEYQVYYPINNQKSVMKKLKLYLLKTIIKMKKEQPKRRRQKSKKKLKGLDPQKQSNFKINKQSAGGATVVTPSPTIYDKKLTINTQRLQQQLELCNIKDQKQMI